MRKEHCYYKYLLTSFTALSFLINAGCASSHADTLPEVVDYKIATPEYTVLAEKSLDLWASNELESFASMLAEDVRYEFPDGKKVLGKNALIDYWKNYKQVSGIQSMKITEANYLPVDSQLTPKGDEMTGIKVVADFTNRMTFSSSNLAVKMHFNFHFNKAKMIDRIMTYYDQTPINTASDKTTIPKI